MIINAGLAEVVFSADYPMGDLSLRLLREAGVKYRQAVTQSTKDNQITKAGDKATS
jgi:deoxycytidylate deaminase